MQAIKNDKVVVCRAPHVKGLRIDELISFVQEEGFTDYLPTMTKNGNWPKISRVWLVNVSFRGPG